MLGFCAFDFWVGLRILGVSVLGLLGGLGFTDAVAGYCNYPKPDALNPKP